MRRALAAARPLAQLRAPIVGPSTTAAYESLISKGKPPRSAAEATRSGRPVPPHLPNLTFSEITCLNKRSSRFSGGTKAAGIRAVRGPGTAPIPLPGHCRHMTCEVCLL